MSTVGNVSADVWQPRKDLEGAEAGASHMAYNVQYPNSIYGDTGVQLTPEQQNCIWS